MKKHSLLNSFKLFLRIQKQKNVLINSHKKIENLISLIGEISFTNQLLGDSYQDEMACIKDLKVKNIDIEKNINKNRSDYEIALQARKKMINQVLKLRLDQINVSSKILGKCFLIILINLYNVTMYKLMQIKRNDSLEQVYQIKIKKYQRCLFWKRLALKSKGRIFKDKIANIKKEFQNNYCNKELKNKLKLLNAHWFGNKTILKEQFCSLGRRLIADEFISNDIEVYLIKYKDLCSEYTMLESQINKLVKDLSIFKNK